MPKNTALALWLIVIASISTGCSSFTAWKTTQSFPSNKAIGIKSVSIQAFKSKTNSGDGTDLAHTIGGLLQKEGYITVRDKGGEGLLSGQLRLSKLDCQSWDEAYEYKGKVYITYYCKCSRSVDASYALKAKGKVWSEKISRTLTFEESSGNSPADAKRQIPTEAEINRGLLDEVAVAVVRDISPHAREVEYQVSQLDSLGVGVKYLQKQRPDQASAIFQQVLDKAPDNKLRASALYNLGVLEESSGNFAKAFEYYRDANQIDLEEDVYIDALSRVEVSKKVSAEFKRQTK